MIDPDNITHGTPDAYRQYLAEVLWFAQIQADLGSTYAAIGDDAGLEYAVRRLVAYLRSVIAALSDLKTMKEDGHAR
ncbi:hypothetical protein [Microvirga lotononidis]|uniref:Uncharacterized protein n=1 Tax=Microvirga lotononidis TaxID=864069 RepID=I4YS92_9HYPH|nr:hypothetical protein [Microvirga lotononidis]EIM26834.1 hypothetical protein MicloDRAFT_00033850 [Microvirga lotononidis]WQO31391.1 hypothetical protein U0023_34475 [Microvirga lotononidis]